MVSEIKLKPCPFCGGNATTVESDPTGEFFICCESCKAFVGVYATENEAVAAWNRRATDGR